jgi:hypothetical protein
VQKKDNTLYIAGGAGGGLLLLLIIIAIAASGGNPREEVDEPAQEYYRPPPPTYKPGAAERGYIMFICSNSPNHEDKEVILKTCSKCMQRTTFHWEEEHKAYRCYSCKNHMGKSDIKCPTCNRHPKKTHLRPY